MRLHAHTTYGICVILRRSATPLPDDCGKVLTSFHGVCCPGRARPTPPESPVRPGSFDNSPTNICQSIPKMNRLLTTSSCASSVSAIRPRLQRHHRPQPSTPHLLGRQRHLTNGSENNPAHRSKHDPSDAAIAAQGSRSHHRSSASAPPHLPLASSRIESEIGSSPSAEHGSPRNHGPPSILTENLLSAIGLLICSRFGPSTSVGIWSRFVYTCSVWIGSSCVVGASCAATTAPLNTAQIPTSKTATHLAQPTDYETRDRRTVPYRKYART